MSFPWAEQYNPKSPFMRWVDDRLPLPRLVFNAVGAGYPVPRNLNYMWNFGVLAGFCLVIQLVTGIVLAMHYAPNAAVAFGSTEADSGVRLTLGATNLGTTPTDMGVRWQIDYQNGGDDQINGDAGDDTLVGEAHDRDPGRAEILEQLRRRDLAENRPRIGMHQDRHVQPAVPGDLRLADAHLPAARGRARPAVPRRQPRTGPDRRGASDAGAGQG